MADAEKAIEWLGSSKADVSAFPKNARTAVGYQIWLVQQGKEPNDCKPMPGVGPGVKEIIVDTGDAFRVFYVAKFQEAVYVLHAFQKATRKTPLRHINLSKQIYKQLIRDR